MERCTLITWLHSCNAVGRPTSISKGGGGDSEGIETSVSSRSNPKRIFESRPPIGGTAVRCHTMVVHCLTSNYIFRRALQYKDDNLDVQKGIATLQERRNILQARLNNWFTIQTVYIPVAQNLRAFPHGADARASRHEEIDGHKEIDDELDSASWSSTDNDAEKVSLFLPSQLPVSLWSTGCMPGLHEIELKLRIAQASDALEQMKQHLCVQSGFVTYKITQVSGPGQKANTRACSLLLQFREKVLRCSDSYRISHAALEILDPTGDWRGQLRPLLEGDVQGPNGKSPDDVIPAMSKRSRATGEGLRELSWIWRVRSSVPRSNAEGSSLGNEADVDRCE